MKTGPKIKAILIDPFQMELYPVQVERDNPVESAKLLDCENVQAVNLGLVARGADHYGWVDEEGLLRTPFVYPHFVIPTANGGHPLAGYGLVTGMTKDGQMLDCDIPITVLAGVLSFEKWRGRISIDNVIPQM